MKSHIIFLSYCILISQNSLISADKPIWTLESKSFKIPENWTWSSALSESRYSRVGLQFSAADEVIISFFQKNRQIELATKATPEKSGSVFAAIFIDKKDGKLINKYEWPVLGEAGAMEQIAFGSRIQSLASGDYVGIINKHLQVLDPSLKTLKDRILDLPKQDGWVYYLTTSLSGPFFILELGYTKYNSKIEIIDSRTLKTVDQEEITDLKVQDIWEDRILGIQKQGQNKYILKEKRIGGSWEPSEINVGSRSHVQYSTLGKIVTDWMLDDPAFRYYWYSINGDSRSEPVIASKNEGIEQIISARHAPVVAVKYSKLNGLRLFLDKNAVYWVVVYDLFTRKVLLKIKADEGMLGYALSSDGRHLAVLTEKKLEMYDVPVEVQTKDNKTRTPSK